VWPKNRFGMALAVVMSFVPVLALIWRGEYLMGAAFTVAIGVTLATRLETERIARRVARVFASAIAVICLSFALGASEGGLVLKATTVRDRMLFDRAEELEGNVIKSGERGLLFFDPKEKKLMVLPWTTVRRVFHSSP
jgi:hypothetical protein